MAPDGVRTQTRHVPVPAVLMIGLDAHKRERTLATIFQQRSAGEHWALICTSQPRQGVINAARDPGGTGGAGDPGDARDPGGAGEAGVSVELVAPGCPCCLGLLPFRIGLIRLLRRTSTHPPSLLLINAGAFGHVAEIRRTLLRAPFTALLRLDATIAGVAPSFCDDAPAQGSAVENLLLENADILLPDVAPDDRNALAARVRMRLRTLGASTQVVADGSWLPRPHARTLCAGDA